jgi:hypothetical protein
MPSRSVVQAIVAVVVAVFTVGLWTSGVPVEAAWLRFYSLAVTVAVAMVGLFDRFLWRMKVLQRFSFVPRDLRGTRKGTLTSMRVDPGTGTAPPPKTAYLVVRQSFSSTAATLITDQAVSRSLFGRLTRDEGSVTLDYMYLSSPKLSVQQYSRMHRGSASLNVAGRPATLLEGYYWTDRDSKGELAMSERVTKCAEDFATAERLFEPTLKP